MTPLAKTSPKSGSQAHARTEWRGWHAVAAVLLVLLLAETWLLLNSGAMHGNDFKHLWAGAWLIAHDLNPYDAKWMFRVAENYRLGAINPYVYLPTTGLMLRPLASQALSFGAAFYIWTWLNALGAAALVWWGPRWLGVARPGVARIAGAALLAGSLPWLRQVTAGQMNVVAAGLMLLAAGALRRRQAGLAGAALGLGFAWKIAPALLIGAAAVLRWWRAAAWGAAACAAALLIARLVCGGDVLRQGFEVIGQMGYGRSTWAERGMTFYRDPANQSINALAHRALVRDKSGGADSPAKPWIDAGPRAANAVTVALVLGLGALWLAAAWRARREPPASVRRIDLFMAATVLMLLAPSIMWDHYVVQLLPALMWWIGSDRALATPGRALGALAILGALMLPVPHGAPALAHGAGLLLGALRLWPTLALYLLLLYGTEGGTGLQD